MKIKQVESVEGFPRLEIRYKSKLPNDVYGLCYADKGLIELSLKQNVTQEMMDFSLFHELLHLALYRTGWGEILETHNVPEEGVVIAMENMLSQLVVFNYKEDVEITKV